MKPIPLPKKTAASPSIVPHDIAPTVKPIQGQGESSNGTEKTKVAEKVAAPKESKKASGKDKSGTKKDSASKAQCM